MNASIPALTPALLQHGTIPLRARHSGSFGEFVNSAYASGALVVQPRMGMSSPKVMREGLLATRNAAATTVGTITLDSFTRTGDEQAVRRAMAADGKLNGYPLVAHGPQVTAAMLDGVRDSAFPVQIRHGSARPEKIFAALIAAGLDATEGGPVSYCLPYSRTPLRESVRAWAECCRMLASLRGEGLRPHLETFGGCMLGQLCPPSLLIAVSVLEAMFFRQHGLRSVSLSYAQQTDPAQDREAVRALRRLAGELLPDVEWHVVLYAYMGVYPRTHDGALNLLESAARLAVDSGAARLIVKTVAEAHRIPSVAENIEALETAAGAAHRRRVAALGGPALTEQDTGLYAEAHALVEAVLGLDDDLGKALILAFERGYLDVPYCLHPDNAGRARSYIDGEGRLQWSAVGSMPIGARVARHAATERLTSGTLLGSLSYVADHFDQAAAERARFPRQRRTTILPPTLSIDESGVRGVTTTVQEPLREAISAAPATRIPRKPPTDPREHLTSPRTRAALRVQQHILTATRAHLASRGFVELLPPVIGPVTDPGVRGSKQVDIDFYGHRYKLMTSAILYKQASLLAFDKFFYIAPNVRLEPLETADTDRHLAEFHQIDVEVAGATRDDITQVAEDLVTAVVRSAISALPREFDLLGRDPDALGAMLAASFGRHSHADAVKMAGDLGHDQSPDAEIDWYAEAMISSASPTAFFITDYPKGSRGFYDREDRDNPGVLRNFDLIVPEGYGELCSGSEREYDYARLVTRMRETGENPAKYEWYLKLAREGLPASAGFGIGLERFTRYVAGLDSVWEANAFPKLPGRVSP